MMLITIALVLMNEKRNRDVVETVANKRVSLNPAMAAKLLFNRSLSANDITSGLLFLANENVLTLSNEGGTPVFKASRSSKAQAEDERFLIEWICYEIGKNGHFSVTDLESFTNDKQKMEAYLQHLEEWERRIVERMKALHLYHPLIKRRMILIGCGLLGVVTGSAYLFFQPFIGIGLLCLALVSFSMIPVISPLTAKGRVEQKKLLGYYESLKTIENKEKGERDLTKAFIYAIAFNVVDRFLTAFPIQEAGEVKVSQEPFPLYYFAPTGTAFLSMEGVKLYRDMEQGFYRVEHPPMVYEDVDSSTGLENG